MLEAEKEYYDMMTYINTLGKLGNEVQNYQRDKAYSIKESFENVKKRAFLELERVFG